MNNLKIIFRLGLLICALSPFAEAEPEKSQLPRSGIDMVIFGNQESEAAHAVAATNSTTIKGGLEESARQLLSLEPQSWEGGRLSFKIKVDPAKPNYVTARFWGSDVNENRLLLYCEGKQIGYRHLGDIDQLDYGSAEPAYNGRFYYNTTPLPVDLTRGRSELQCEIRSSGPIFGYAGQWEKYQKPMTQPTRGIYAVYTHTDGCFVPPANEKQGEAAKTAPVRETPGPEVIEQVKELVNHEIDARLNSAGPLSQMQMLLLAKAYRVRWTHAFENPKSLAQVLKSLDAIFAAYRKNPKLAQSEPSTWNPDWFGLGPSGLAIALLAEPLRGQFDQQIADGIGGRITRRAAFTEMLVACRDWHRLNRRLYSNQTMIHDLYGIYLANKGIAVLTPAKAMTEMAVRRYLYESVGLEMWRDSDPGGHQSNAGKNYFQLTAKGLTKELGYVGSYGEVLDWANEIYDATRPAPSLPGDERIKAQLAKIAHARAAFRYPSLDAQGNRTMRLEQVIGWRDSHYPGDIVYAQRPSRDASALRVAATTLDPDTVGWAQQMMADNQFFASEEHVMEEKNLRVTIGRLETPDQYELIKAQRPNERKLPMTWSQPDYVFTDEEDGVVAIKEGNEIFYASLYWRARFGINNLARVHYLTPNFDRIAVVHEETQFEPSGFTYTRPNWTNFGFGGGGPKYPVDLQSAHAGEKLPIAKIPEGIPFKPGDENVYAGKGDFYTLRYGHFLIGLNMSEKKTFELKIPAEAKVTKELVSKRSGSIAGGIQKVGPRSTVVFQLEE